MKRPRGLPPNPQALAKRVAERAFRFSASTSRFLGGAFVTKWASSLSVAAAISSTASSKATAVGNRSW